MSNSQNRVVGLIIVIIAAIILIASVIFGQSFYPYNAWLCWGFPILGAILAPLLAKFHPKARDYGAILFGYLGALMAFSMTSAIFSGVAWDGTQWQEVISPWINVPGLITIDWGMLIDPLSVFMACVATGVGFIILAYSLGYMKGDSSLTRYWFFMQFFIGGMVILVMANNLLLTFIGWEIVGLCSYALIGFWYNRPNMVHDDQLGDVTEGELNSHSGMKAFIVTRVGDVGLLISIIFIFFFTVSAGNPTLNYQILLADYTWLGQMALVLNGVLMLTVFLLFFLGPIGKSAQFPLQFWLPEAMAGPSTVSALIHAAAMVKAGVYLVARMSPILVQGYYALSSIMIPALYAIAQNTLLHFFLIIAIIGTFTAFMAATMALVAKELKKVLAFSTISQLGYMFMALGIFAFTADGVYGYTAATFHLAAHAIFKALLFLSAGAVLHSVHSKYLDDMGGIRKAMPITFAVMLIGALALSGVPPFGGFWSKEAIFSSAYNLWQAGSQWGMIFLFFGAITAAFTIFYSFRMIGLTFLGNPSKNVKDLEAAGTPVHEAPGIMWVPLAILAVATFIIGFLEPFLLNFFYQFWDLQYSLIPHAPHLASLLEMYLEFFIHVFTSPTFLITIGALLLGGIPGYIFYIRGSRSTDFAGRGFARRIYNFLYNRWYWNGAMYLIFVDGGLRVARGMYKYIETKGIDKFNYVVADSAMGASRGWRRLQTGVHSWNMILLLIGALAFILLLLIFQFYGGLLIPLPFP
ncbi:MAG: NADH-quinone oxidoreductase subunit L [Candidatus Odinarchaeota archaeon]